MATIILIMAAAYLFYLFQRALYGKMWSRGLSATIGFECESAMEGDTISFSETVTNAKWLPLPAVELKFQSDKNLHFNQVDNLNTTDKGYIDNVYSLLFFQQVKRKLSVNCLKRGYYSIDQLELVSSDLFMTSNMVLKKGCFTNLLVYPSLVDISRILIPYNMVMGNILNNRNRYLTDPFEFRGIRDYDINDTMKSINWKMSAKTGSLKVNLYDYTASQNVHILLNLDSGSVWEYDDLKEESIRIACSLSKIFIEEGISTSITSNGCDSISKKPISIPNGSGKNHIDNIAASLARCTYGGELENFTDIISNIENRKDGSSPLYILISIDTKKELQESFDSLCHDTLGSLFLNVYNLDSAVDSEPAFIDNFYPWEVSRNA